MAVSPPSVKLQPADIAERLSTTSGFSELSSECLHALSNRFAPRFFRTGASLLHEGLPGESVYVLLSGRAKMVRTLEGGRQLLLALFHPGDTFGTTSTMGKRRCDASVVALQDVFCLELTRDDFFALMRSRPELIEELMPVLAQPLSECRNCTVELSCLRVEQRFAKLLLKLAETVGQEGPDGIFIPVKLSRQELADMTGTTIETCIRTMSRWGKNRWVETRKNGFLVQNLGDLEALSHTAG